MIGRLTATREERINFGVLKENPMNRKLNFVEIKKNTSLCLEYTFDFLYFRT
jgi:hypothetical protein